MASRKRSKSASPALTVPDLVVLGLLSERPMHGYELVAELERREVKDWAGISRPQVYYSLDKLAKGGLLKPVADDRDPAGPERKVFAVTPRARSALAHALDRERWAEQRPPPPFLTWTALSFHATPEAISRVVTRRRRFLEEQVRKETATLEVIRQDHGPMVRLAEAIVELVIRQFRLELEWLEANGRVFSSLGAR